MRVAFTLIGGSHWTGGRNYLLNLLQVLTTHARGTVSPVLFVPQNCTDEQLASFVHISGLELIKSDALTSERRKRSLLQALLMGSDSVVRSLFLENRIDLVFESAQFFGRNIGLPSIAWIPDFQHHALPHLFSRAAWWQREIGFRAQISGNRTIMLSSEDAKADCERIYPATRGRCYTVHFAIPPHDTVPFNEARRVADSYGLPQQFFFMPNQFWRHKNHEIVIDALALLKASGKEIVVAASGMQSDPRDPKYFPFLQAKLEQLSLVSQFKLLSVIPYPHLAALMRTSTALLNPSLFEGWSTTVEEAKSYGTPMILSDLNVHREQAGADAVYFDQNSPQALANALESFVALEPAAREVRINSAKQAAESRVQKFADDFRKLAEACIARAKK